MACHEHCDVEKNIDNRRTEVTNLGLGSHSYSFDCFMSLR